MNDADARKHQDICTAYHEAGHAAAAVLQGYPLEFVSIVPTGNAAGRTRLAEYPANLKESRDLTVKAIVILFAGSLAEARFKGNALNLGNEQDIRQAIQQAEHEWGPGEDAEDYTEYLRVTAANIVNDALYWFAIGRLADALIVKGELTRQESLKVFRDAIAEARGLGPAPEW